MHRNACAAGKGGKVPRLTVNSWYVGLWEVDLCAWHRFSTDCGSSRVETQGRGGATTIFRRQFPKLKSG